MPKNIVICSDGTGNTAIMGRGTNVFKLYEAVDLNGHKSNPDLTPQLAIYDDGVGTENFRPIKIFAGITGFGLARNVRLLYKSLVRVYDPGDSIFLFGFSRGAFTVRALGGLISKCGILDASTLPTTESLNAAVRQAYRVHRQDYRTKLGTWFGLKPNRKLMARFKQRYSRHVEVRIRFMGVWDTVDAVGVPWHISDFINMTMHRFKFPDQKLPPFVDHACQALSLDDERQTFYPLLWEHDSRIEQVWFAGCHSNVGGGYEKQGMSLVSLDWMMRQAEARGGLRLLASDRKLYREHANVDDKLYDPRAGPGILYRWAPRDMEAICRRHGVPPLIHLSAVERIAHGTGDYSPGNIAPHVRVVITEADSADEMAALLSRARDVERVLAQAHEGGKPLLDRVEAEILVGRAAYYVYLLPSTAAVLAACVPQGAGMPLNPMILVRSVWAVVLALASFHGGPLIESARHLLHSPTLLSLVIGGQVASWLIGESTGSRMSAVFSVFWHEQQPKLREALKMARETAAATQAERR
jgi:uncharacterized protein (DUF2235 family)